MLMCESQSIRARLIIILGIKKEREVGKNPTLIF
jgi:hypothetical protein